MMETSPQITITFFFFILIIAQNKLILPRIGHIHMLEWWNGRHEGLKIPWPLSAVRVRVPLRAPLFNIILDYHEFSAQIQNPYYTVHVS